MDYLLGGQGSDTFVLVPVDASQANFSVMGVHVRDCADYNSSDDVVDFQSAQWWNDPDDSADFLGDDWDTSVTTR